MCVSTTSITEGRRGGGVDSAPGLAPGPVPPAHARPDEDRHGLLRVERGGCLSPGGGKHPRQCGPSRRPSTHVSPRPITRHSAIPRRFSAARACRARRPQTRRPNRPDPPIRSLADRTLTRFGRTARVLGCVGRGERRVRHERRALTPMGGHRRRALASAGSTVGAAAGRRRHFVRSPRKVRRGVESASCLAPGARGLARPDEDRRGVSSVAAGGVCHAGGGKHPRQCGPSRRLSTYLSPRPITRHSTIPRRFSAARAGPRAAAANQAPEPTRSADPLPR